MKNQTSKRFAMKPSPRELRTPIEPIDPEMIFTQDGVEYNTMESS